MLGTRASNKLVHPGKPIAPKPHRTKGEVKAKHAAKAQAKVDYKEVKKQSIIHAAEFKHADRANEDLVDSTPHPPFTPKIWPPLHNKNKANPIPVVDISDVEMSDDVDNTSFVPSYSKKFVSEDDSAIESDNPPPFKRSKAQTAGKAIAKVGIKVTRKVGKKTKADEYNEEIVPASDEEQPQEPKLKKVKVKMHNEINIVAKKIENKTQETQSKYGDIVKSMSTTQAEDGSNGKPASKTPS